MAVDVGESRRGPVLLATCIVVPVLTIIFVVLRIWARIFVLHSVGWDDYTAVVTLIFCVTYSILIGISTDRSIVPEPSYVKWINNADFIYLISLLGYKMSILVVYLRLFAVNKRFRYATWLMIFFVCGYLSSNLWTQIFGCSPRAKYWKPEIPGHCINYTKAGLAYGSMNIVSDLFIFILPLPIIWQLKLPIKEKAGVSLIFMSGAITCTAAIVRYATIVRENEADAKYFIWSTIEIDIGVMCSCMPAFKPFLARILPKLNVSRSYLPRFSVSKSPRVSRSARRGTRLRSPEAPEHTDDGVILEMRTSEQRDKKNYQKGHISPNGFYPDGGIRIEVGV